jgi:predicted ABC-type ATPase
MAALKPLATLSTAPSRKRAAALLAPVVVVIAGPNGAGKTTYAEALLGALGIREFVNADRIAQGLSGMNTASVGIAAGRIMIERLRMLARQRVSFGFETTLSSRSFAPFLQRLRQEGYAVRIFYVMLPTANEALFRVRRRVRQGGHGLEADVVKRRFGRSARNFLELYLPLAQSWAVSENPRDGNPIEVARGAQGSSIIISDEQRWLKLHRIATNARS